MRRIDDGGPFFTEALFRCSRSLCTFFYNFNLNAGMALYLGIDGISLAEGVEKAKELIESGAALKKYEEFREATKAVAAK